jgi:allantoate deiminase
VAVRFVRVALVFPFDFHEEKTSRAHLAEPARTLRSLSARTIELPFMAGAPPNLVSLPSPSEWARSSTEEALERCDALGACSETKGAILRRALTPAMRDAHALLRGWAERAGLTVHVDALGNLRARREGPPGSRTLVLGSHVDTVRDAGRYDGPLGVVLAIAVAEALREIALPFALEVIAISDEEGVRFGRPFLGARALAGTLDVDDLALRDADGVTLAEAIAHFESLGTSANGFGDVEGLDACAIRPEDLLAYVEVHIEQGPVLESLELPVGVVTGIAGHVWRTVTFEGRAGHAGTTPMTLRRDALAAASELTLAVERLASETPGLVSTVGQVVARPGGNNVIAGRAELELDVRSVDARVLADALATLDAQIAELAARRGVKVSARDRFASPPVVCAPALQALLSESVRRVGLPVHALPSGAGHDGRILATLGPIAMLFVRSPEGLSHHPDERVHAIDVALALDVTLDFVRALAARVSGTDSDSVTTVSDSGSDSVASSVSAESRTA